MNRKPFTPNSSYQHLVQRLHALVRAGGRESRAGALYLCSEEPWESLTEVEFRRIVGLCEDLGSLLGAPAPTLPMVAEAQRRLREASEARQVGEWDRALNLLRRWGEYLQPALLAYLRGTIWMEAGDHATAALFLRRAAELEPANESYSRLYRYTLATAKRLRDRVRPREVVLPEAVPA